LAQQVDLILKDINDPYVRENFARLSRYLNDQTILAGNWAFYRIEVPSATQNFEFRHSLTFTPKDIIVLSIDGNKNVDFRFDLFTTEFIVFSTEGACSFRILAGSYPDKLGTSLKNLNQIPVGGPDIIVPPVGSEISSTMDCLGTTAVGDWVAQSLTIDNFAEKLSNNLGTNPIIGIVKSKPTATTCVVLFFGVYALTYGRGKIHLSTTGNGTTTAPATGNIQQLGISFGNGTILVKPESVMLRRV
jgi:hypothetical protein